MNKEAFYAALRKRDSGVFGTSLSSEQVEGVEAILAAGGHLDLPQLAYILGTAYGESKMKQLTESMYYTTPSHLGKTFGSHRRQGYKPEQLVRNPELLANTVYGGEWGRKNLGNTEPGDGWRYIGRGYPQTTGRRNYKVFGDLVGVDLVANPERALEPEIAAKSLVVGFERGLWRGPKLSDFDLPRQYREARAILNHPSSYPDRYANYARAFEAALVAAGYRPQTVATDAEAPAVQPMAPAMPKTPQRSPWASLWAALTRALATSQSKPTTSKPAGRVVGQTPNGLPIYATAADFPWDAKRWPNFKPTEFDCKGTGTIALDFDFLDKLQALRSEWGKPLKIMSGYRSPEHNRNVGGASRSKHMEGIAADIPMPRKDQTSFKRLAEKHGFNGIGTYSTFIHIDTRSQRARW